MKMIAHKTASIGQLIAAAFDEAAEYSTDPREVSHLATRAVTHMLRGLRRASVSAPMVLARASRHQRTAA